MSRSDILAFQETSKQFQVFQGYVRVREYALFGTMSCCMGMVRSDFGGVSFRSYTMQCAVIFEALHLDIVLSSTFCTVSVFLRA